MWHQNEQMKNEIIDLYKPQKYIFEDNKKIWLSFYKPEHLNTAAKCSKCKLYYWQIEKQLSDINITSPDIFYQTYDTKGSGGKMVCRLCDPEAFKNNKQ